MYILWRKDTPVYLFIRSQMIVFHFDLGLSNSHSLFVYSSCTLSHVEMVNLLCWVFSLSISFVLFGCLLILWVLLWFVGGDLCCSLHKTGYSDTVDVVGDQLLCKIKFFNNMWNRSSKVTS